MSVHVVTASQSPHPLKDAPETNPSAPTDPIEKKNSASSPTNAPSRTNASREPASSHTPQGKRSRHAGFSSNPTEQLSSWLVSTRVDDDSDETGLGKRISDLWSSGGLRRTKINQNREELRLVQTELSRDLHRYKGLLARTGRGGQWAAFLREHGIPRATANRYVKQCEEALNPSANRLSEPLSAPTVEQIAALAKKTRAKVIKVLTTEDSKTQFLEALSLALRESSPAGQS